MPRVVAIAVVMLAVASCGDDTTMNPLDSGAAGGGGGSTGSSPDLAQRADLAAGADLAAVADLATPGDLAQPVGDMALSPDLSPVCGGGIACTSPSDCPATGSACVIATCNGGCCATANAASGTTAGGQTAGDCQRIVCDGNGATTSVDDATDLPVQSSMCEVQPACVGSPLAPSFTPAPGGTACVADDSPQAKLCGAGTLSGQCVECNFDGDCSGSGTCNGSVYTPPPICTSSGACKAPAAADCSTGGLQCLAGVGCVQCRSATDCPGQDTECQTRICAASICGFANAPAGAPTAAQTLGDCREMECDGAGNIVSAANNSDVPTAPSDCSSGVCSAGAPQFPPSPAGQTCNSNGGSLCDGAGNCVQCNSASDCPAPPGLSFCAMATCTSGVCGAFYPGTGTSPPAFQTPGDCQRVACNGSGGVVSVDDPTDLPVSSSICESSPSCSGSPLAPSFTPASTGTDCTADGNPPNHVCGDTANGNIAGVCVQCNTNADCAAIGLTTCHVPSASCS